MINRLLSICARFFNVSGISSPAPAAAPEEAFLANATLLASYAHQELQQFRAWTNPATDYSEHARMLQQQLKQVQQELKALQKEYRTDQHQARTTIERQHPAAAAVLQEKNAG